MIHADAAPLLIVNDLLDADLAAQLVCHADAQGWFRSPMVRPDDEGRAVLVADVEAKARHDHRLVDARLTSLVQKAMMERLLPVVARSFALAPRSHEAFKVVRYDAGDGWFSPHRDNVTPDAAHRRLAVTINLNHDYEGGCLRFPEFGEDEYRPHAGAAIVFSCALLHEVTPVTLGHRHALLSFLW